MASGGVLYVFLLLAGLSCNQFAFEEGGMRSLILSPIDRKHILMGKNLALTIVAFLFSAVLLTINTIVFRDLTVRTLLFAGLAFIIYAATISTFGNWMSIRFPKRMEFGKRMNVSGVAGLLFLPMFALMAAPPVLSVLAGYYTSNLPIEFLTLTGFCLVTTGIYSLAIGFQGRTLARKEIEILEAVREPVE
jgi:ABC-type Na+ efflux pump permease subunit